MAIDRPLSEHEGALFDAMRVFGVTLLDMGADKNALNGRLSEAMAAAEKLGNKNGALLLEFLIRALFPTPEPAPKPSFRVV
jgi:hypothetical protein